MSTAHDEETWVERFTPWLVGNRSANGEHRGYCPIHEDPAVSNTPSASFNFSKHLFRCFGGDCGIGVSFHTLWDMILEERGEDHDDRPDNVTDMATAKRKKREVEEDDKKRLAELLPTEEELLDMTEILFRGETVLRAFKEKRGLTDEFIRKAKIGWNQRRGRYSIPVYDEFDDLVGVRLYKIDAKASQAKMQSWVGGTGRGRLFGLPAIKDSDWVIICEGELDALLLQMHGYPAISNTVGAGTWLSHWNQHVAGKTVYICYDVDDAGIQGAQKVKASLFSLVPELYIVHLPVHNIPHGDVTDYFVSMGHTPDDFDELLKDSRKVNHAKTARGIQGEPVRVSLEDSMSSEFTDKPIEVVVTIAGKVQPAHSLPQRVALTCSQDQGKACARCPMVAWKGEHRYSLPKETTFLLKMVDKSEEQREKVILKDIGIPTLCTKVELKNEASFAVEELLVMPNVDDHNEQTQTPISRRVLNVGPHNTPINTVARFVGVNTSDPKTGRSLLQTWDCEQTKTNLDKFKMTPEIAKELSIFQIRDEQDPIQQLKAIAEDLAANVTHIYGRVPLHIAYDLVWHSVMDFKFRGTYVGKGWLELLVMGDTRTGKSEAAMRLTDHYQAGVLKSCEGATLAGLVGGAQQMGSSWIVTWGTIPLQDRRLVVLDEVSGIADKNIIEQMSAVRSSGKAQINKIVTQETSARTRLIWISNPVDGRTLAETNRGAIEAIQKLIKNPEDIARFDIAMSAASDDVDSSIINSTEPPKVPHRYTKEKCSKLVAWVWSRKSDDVVWAEGVEDHVMQRARELGANYVPDPPLIQSENVRVKLARIAVAVAARLFSTDPTGEQVVVKKQHVDAAVRVLNVLYGTKSMGYKEHSQKEIRSREAAEANKRQCERWLMSHDAVRFTLETVINDSQFRIRDFEDFGAMDRDSAQAAAAELVKMRMVRRQSKGYMKMQPELITIVRRLEEQE